MKETCLLHCFAVRVLFLEVSKFKLFVFAFFWWKTPTNGGDVISFSVINKSELFMSCITTREKWHPGRGGGGDFHFKKDKSFYTTQKRLIYLLGKKYELLSHFLKLRKLILTKLFLFMPICENYISNLFYYCCNEIL